MPFIIGLLLLFTGIGLCLTFDQTEQFMAVNRLNNPALDWFFRIYTNLGDGVFMLIVAVLLLFRKFKYSILVATSFVFSGLAAQLFKRLTKVSRPGKVFVDNPDWYAVPDYHIHGNNSFPSGHTTTAFALMAILYYIFPSQRKSPLLMILACLAAYSRVYLSQHWPMDVFVGALLGCFTSILLIYSFERSNWYHQNWANKHFHL